MYITFEQFHNSITDLPISLHVFRMIVDIMKKRTLNFRNKMGEIHSKSHEDVCKD